MARPAFPYILSPELAVNCLGQRLRSHLSSPSVDGSSYQQSPTPIHAVKDQRKEASPSPRADPPLPRGRLWIERRSHLLSRVGFYLCNLRDAGQFAQSSQGNPLMHCLQFGPAREDKGEARAPTRNGVNEDGGEGHTRQGTCFRSPWGQVCLFPPTRVWDSTLKWGEMGPT